MTKFQTAAEIAKDVRTKKRSAREVCEEYLSRVEKLDPSLHAFLTIAGHEARQRALEVDEQIARKEDPGALAGVPFAIKDNILTEGIQTTAGSKILEGYRAVYDATVIKRLKEAGAIIVGKTNLDEFGMGASTESSAYFKTLNPWDTARVPGGSSGGSAVAVASGMTPVGLGSDTGGSIRQPASFCGIVGVRPSYGRVSRSGLIAMTSSLDQVGPLATTVDDAAQVFLAIAGRDAADATTVDKPLFTLPDIAAGVEGLRVGVPRQYFIEGMDPGVEKAVREAIEVLRSQGARVIDVDLPLTDYSLAVYYLTVTSEASSNLARYDGIRYPTPLSFLSADSLWEAFSRHRGARFGDEAKRRIILGTFTLSRGYYDQYYVQAQKVRALIAKEFSRVFVEVDVIATPTSPSFAFKLGERFDDPLAMYLSDIFTTPASVADLPAISVPCGFVRGLPVGLQLVSRLYDEATMFRVARSYERATDWHDRHPAYSIQL